MSKRKQFVPTKNGVADFTIAGQIIITVLLFAKNTPGVVYCGGGQYLLACTAFAHSVGYTKEGAERLHRHIQSLLKMGLLTKVSYDRNPDHVLVELPPIIDNFDERRLLPEKGNLHQQARDLFLTTVNRFDSLEALKRSVVNAIPDTSFTGFDNPDNWKYAQRILAAYTEKGSAGLVDNLPLCGTVLGEVIPFDELPANLKGGIPDERSLEYVYYLHEKLEKAKAFARKAKLAQRKRRGHSPEERAKLYARDDG